jgi:predicted dehydrogenase
LEILPRLIVMGAGRIGSANDRLGTKTPLSHIGAALAAGTIDLTAVIEPAEAARNSACKLWRARTGARFVGSLEELTDAGVEVVALCTPTETRARDVAAALELAPRLLIIEKPLAPNPDCAARILRAIGEAGVAVLVNYNRRFDPATARFESLFPGQPLRVVARYGKGLVNYASHMVDLFTMWFGPVEAVQATSTERETTNKDVSLSFRLCLKSGLEIQIISIDGATYDQFEIDVLFEDRVLSYLSGGAEQAVRFPRNDLHYRGYSHVPSQPDEVWRGQVGGFLELYQAVGKHFGRGVPIGGCSGTEALEVQQVLWGARESASQEGRLVRLGSSVRIQEQ